MYVYIMYISRPTSLDQKGNDKGSPSQSKKRETTKKKKTDPPAIHIHRQGSLLFLLQGV